MGDRTFVCLRVMSDDSEKTTIEMNRHYRATEIHKDGTWVEFYIDEVNYGELSIQEWAEKEGIPYTYRWESGGDYGPGSEHLRFNEKGEPHSIMVSDEELQLNLSDVSELITKTDAIEDVREAYSTLRSFLAAYVETSLPLPWETQERNKLIARTVNLISKP